MPTLAPEPTRELVCPGCGRRRTVSSRHARRVPATCKLCRNPAHTTPTVKEMYFWLERFSDEEIVQMASAIHGGEGDEAACRSFRELLLGREGMVAA